MMLKSVVVEVTGFNPRKWHDDAKFIAIRVTPRQGGLPDEIEPIMGVRVRYNGKVGKRTLREVARTFVEHLDDNVLIQPFDPEHRFWGTICF